MAKILNKCPLCRHRLQYSRMMSYTLDALIKLNGEAAAREKKSDVGSMECGFISCTNKDCDFSTDCYLKCQNNVRIKIWQEGDKFYYEKESEG